MGNAAGPESEPQVNKVLAGELSVKASPADDDTAGILKVPVGSPLLPRR